MAKEGGAVVIDAAGSHTLPAPKIIVDPSIDPDGEVNPQPDLGVVNMLDSAGPISTLGSDDLEEALTEQNIQGEKVAPVYTPGVVDTPGTIWK